MDQASAKLCLGAGGVRIDRAVSAELLQAVAPQAIEAAVETAVCAANQRAEVLAALRRELEDAQYNAALAARRYEAVDPAIRLVARELEARWENALLLVRNAEVRIAAAERASLAEPPPAPQELLRLAQELPRVWNAEAADMRLKQHILRILLVEVILDRSESNDELVLTLH